MGVFHEAARELANLCIPSSCAGCGAWDQTLCDQCFGLSQSFVPTWEVIDSGWAEYPLWSLSEYSGSMRSIILAAKHSGCVDLSPFLFECGKTIGDALGKSGMLEVGQPHACLWIVPAPSSWKRRFFGHPVTSHIAHGVAQGIRLSAPVTVAVRDICRLDPWVSSQAGKNSDKRREARRGHMYVSMPIPQDVGLVAVDDVVATGGTMSELFRVCGKNWVAGACIARARR